MPIEIKAVKADIQPAEGCAFFRDILTDIKVVIEPKDKATVGLLL